MVISILTSAILGKTIGDSLMKNCKNLSYIIINPRKEFRTLKDKIEEGKEHDFDMHSSEENIPRHLKEEIDFYRNVTNEIIDIRGGAEETIS